MLRPSTDSPSVGRELRELVLQVARGDANALRELLLRTRVGLAGVAGALLERPTDVETVLVDVFLEVWRRAAEFHPLAEDPLTWLVVLTRQRAFLAVREGSPTALGRGGRASREASLPGALPPSQQRPLELVLFGGRTHREAADLLGCSTARVGECVRRGLRALENAQAASSR